MKTMDRKLKSTNKIKRKQRGNPWFNLSLNRSRKLSNCLLIPNCIHTSPTNSILVPNKLKADMLCLMPKINFSLKELITLSIKTRLKINQDLQQLFPSGSKRQFQSKSSQSLLFKKTFFAFLLWLISHNNARQTTHPSFQLGTTPAKSSTYKVRNFWNIVSLKSTRECLQTSKSYA